jgi:hypothetical protein
MTRLVPAVVIVSVVAPDVSVTPLMNFYVPVRGSLPNRAALTEGES